MNLRYIDLDENLLTRGSDGTYYRLRIGQDDWIDSPRDWSPLGHMHGFSVCRKMVHVCMIYRFTETN